MQPTTDRIARLDPDVLAECELGYRTEYIVASAKMIAAGFPDIDEIMSMMPGEAKEKLMGLPGIGDYAAVSSIPWGLPDRRLVDGRVRTALLREGTREQEGRD